MKAKIYSHNNLIGIATLEIGDATMGGVFGNFEPTDLYFNNVQKHVWEFWGTNKPNYQKWESLRFNAQLENGLFLFPQGGYTYSDMKGIDDDPIQIDLAGLDFEIIEEYFLNNRVTSLVEDPWSSISISQKIAFEDELEKELGNKEISLFDIFKPKSKRHLLANSEFSAFGSSQINDDVLFEVRSPDISWKYAVVHLTWTKKKENVPYPITTIYEDFEEFRQKRMII